MLENYEKNNKSILYLYIWRYGGSEGATVISFILNMYLLKKIDYLYFTSQCYFIISSISKNWFFVDFTSNMANMTDFFFLHGQQKWNICRLLGYIAFFQMLPHLV
jgi:hypothetical protein